AGRNPELLERVLEGQRIDDRREHPHVVARRAVDVRAARQAPEDVAASDHERELATERVHVLQFAREGYEDAGIDAVAAGTGERLPADLEEDAAIARRAGIVRRGLSLRARLQQGSP